MKYYLYLYFKTVNFSHYLLIAALSVPLLCCHQLLISSCIILLVTEIVWSLLVLLSQKLLWAGLNVCSDLAKLCVDDKAGEWQAHLIWSLCNTTGLWSGGIYWILKCLNRHDKQTVVSGSISCKQTRFIGFIKLLSFSVEEVMLVCDTKIRNG